MKTFRRKVVKAELEYSSYHWYCWLLDLDCGHFVSKHQSSRKPPATTLCHHCQKQNEDQTKKLLQDLLTGSNS